MNINLRKLDPRDKPCVRYLDGDLYFAYVRFNIDDVMLAHELHASTANERAEQVNALVKDWMSVADASDRAHRLQHLIRHSYAVTA